MGRGDDGIEFKLTPDDKKTAIKLSLDNLVQIDTAEITEQQKDIYIMKLDKKEITIIAREPVGVFRAAQTLRKSLPVVKSDAKSIELPFVEIQDEPRFEYRGVLLDCGRHFFTVDFIKQFIDVMALHGSNQFHSHLTEGQGWRFEVKAYPTLATRGSVRAETVICPGNSGIYDGVPYGGYYTQDECREVVRYVAENQLQSYINREVEAFMKERGRDIIDWDEILDDGLSGSSIVMSWRGIKGRIAAARQRHRIIMSPNVYR